MKNKQLLDAYALLAYLQKEKNHHKVVEALASPRNSVLMNEINIGECYYIIARERDKEQADYFIDTVINNLPIRIIANSFEDIIAAARVKSLHPLSYADCFAVATAIRENAVILTGDPEFKKVKHLVAIDWL